MHSIKKSLIILFLNICISEQNPLFFIRRLNTIMLKNPHGALFAVPAHFWVSSHKGKGKKCACEKKIDEGGGGESAN